MSFNDCKISESEIQTTGVQAQADTLTGSAADNKMVFDALPTLVIQKLNSLIDQMQQQAAAGQIGVTPFDGMTAQTLQDALEQIHADIGGNYGGADGAGKVGYTPSEGVDEDTVQAAIEAVQANLTAYIAKIKAATGAAEVGNAPIVGMTATNVQQALEELRKNIDNIVSGIIPGGSITSDMLQDGAVTADKLGSDVTGDTIPTSASDPTSISSQLSNLESSKLNKTLRTGSGQDLNAIIPSSGSIEVYRVFNPSANVPPGYTENSCDFFLIAICEAAQLYVRQYAFDVRSTAIWTRRSYDDSGVIHWQDWKQIVLATPPQEFDLPLASGWSNYSGMRSRYWKNQFDEVSVVVDISNPNTVSHGAVVATLPEGFRPAAAFDAPTIIYDGSEILPVRAYFSTNGQISISGYSNQTWSKVLFFETQASFIAVS